MCIIIVKPQGASLPPIETLSYCALRNPDGFGFAVPGRVFKSMSFDRFYAELVTTIRPEMPAVLHFRFATHGRPCKSNCHPFRDEKTGVSFAHNGVLPITPYAGKTDSETAFRGLILPKIRQFGLDSGETDAEICGIIGASRFAILSDKGEIRLYGHFIKADGCLYSNANFRPFYGSY